MFHNTSVLQFAMELFDFQVKHPDSKPRLVRISENFSTISHRSGSSARFEKHMLGLIDQYGTTTAELSKLSASRLYNLCELCLPPLQSWEHALDAWATICENHDQRKIRLEFLNDLRVVKREREVLRDSIDGDFFLLLPGDRVDLFSTTPGKDRPPIAQVRTHMLTPGGKVNPLNYAKLVPLPPIVERVLTHYHLIEPACLDQVDGQSKLRSTLRSLFVDIPVILFWVATKPQKFTNFN